MDSAENRPCVVVAGAGAGRGGRGSGPKGTGLTGAGRGVACTGGMVGRVGGGASVATTGTILLRAPAVLGLCRLLATRLTPWPDLEIGLCDEFSHWQASRLNDCIA